MTCVAYYSLCACTEMFRIVLYSGVIHMGISILKTNSMKQRQTKVENKQANKQTRVDLLSTVEIGQVAR